MLPVYNMSKCCTTDFSSAGTITLPPRTIADSWVKIAAAGTVPAIHINTSRAVKPIEPQVVNNLCQPKTRIFYTAGGEMVKIEM